MIVQSRLSTSGLAPRADAFWEARSEESCTPISLFGAAAICVFERGLGDFVAPRFLPARSVDASLSGFGHAAALKRKTRRYWVAPIQMMQRNSSVHPVAPEAGD